MNHETFFTAKKLYLEWLNEEREREIVKLSKFLMLQNAYVEIEDKANFNETKKQVDKSKQTIADLDKQIHEKNL